MVVMIRSRDGLRKITTPWSRPQPNLTRSGRYRTLPCLDGKVIGNQSAQDKEKKKHEGGKKHLPPWLFFFGSPHNHACGENTCLQPPVSHQIIGVHCRKLEGKQTMRETSITSDDGRTLTKSRGNDCET